MIRSTAAMSALVMMLCLAGCDTGRDDKPAEATAPAAPATPVAGEVGSDVGAPAAVDAPAAKVAALADGAPAFAALYPGAVLDEPAVTAVGDDGPGGLATFHADAAPEQVVAFYRRRAEAAGLVSTMGMNQGAARAYGAAASAPNGPSLQVVASPAEAGGASVQVTWSEGR